MGKLITSPQGIFDLSWSPDSAWITYSEGGNAYILSAHSGEIRKLGTGQCPQLTRSLSAVVERDDQIVLISGAQEKVLVSLNDLVKGSPKRQPVVGADGQWVLFVVSHVFDKRSESLNAYAYRHFFGLAQTESGKAKILGEQYYGGNAVFFPDGKQFAHFEFDSTGGPQVHIVDLDGVGKVVLPGLYPAISPDGKQIAVRPKSGGAVIVYSTRGGWTKAEIESRVLSLPSDGTRRTSANPPLWLDNRLLLVDEGETMLRLDTKRDKAEEHKKVPVPAARRRPTMALAPNLERLAIEVEADGAFELQLILLA